MDMRVVGVDIGSAQAKRSAFARAAREGDQEAGCGPPPDGAVHAVLETLSAGTPTVLALEAPACIPVPGPGQWHQLGKARDAEGNRAWSAGAGSGVLATGLAQGAWMLAKIHRVLPDVTATTQPARWPEPAALLLAEALVSGAGKPAAGADHQHLADAWAAARACSTCLRTGTSR